MPQLKWRSWTLVLWLVCACGGDAPAATQVVIDIDADVTVRMQARGLRIQVHAAPSRDLVGIEERLTREISPGVGDAPDYPVRLALTPSKGHEDWVFVVTATAFEGSRDVAFARLVSQYVSGRVKYARLLIESACISGPTDCAPDQTCKAGACAEAFIDPTTLPDMPTASTDGGDLDGGAEGGARCTTHSDCDNGEVCDGTERCDPESSDADSNGCISGEPMVCDDDIDCTADMCSESARTCVFLAPDVDQDGHRDVTCVDGAGDPLGDDCDDNDSNRFPGNVETCDDHDEDCDPITFGVKDDDGDGAVDELCCNTDALGDERCGLDCDDGDIAPHARQPEFCDGLDNDCDGDMEEVQNAVEWFVDDDGDGFGAPGVAIVSCTPQPRHSLVGTDCDDSDDDNAPNADESCDAIDNDCDLAIDEGLSGCATSGDPSIPRVNPCLNGLDDCHASARCAWNGSDTFTCTCRSGFDGDGHGSAGCTDIDECDLDNGGCDTVPMATCTNLPGARDCACPNMYAGDGEGENGCVQGDACAIDNGNCGDAQYWRCTHVPSAEPLCAPIDQCDADNGDCGDARYWQCTDNPGAAPTCTDINECFEDNGGCDTTPMATCNNRSDAANTCTCPAGYSGTGVGDSGCQEINECTQNTDDCDESPAATCVNAAGGFTCTCPSGYVGDGHGTNGCMDEDECAMNNGGCDTSPMAVCTDQEGLPSTCTCPTGYSGNGVGSNGCTDINECTQNTDDCDNTPAATCTNMPGTFSCACPTGYSGNGVGSNGCMDINECSTNNGGCGAVGAWTCVNNPGPTPTCTDINECNANTDDCDTMPVASCSNTSGGFTCACPAGYSGSGRGSSGCVDVDECMANTDDCDTAPSATCTNTPGSFTCACPNGYQGDGHGSSGCVVTLTCAVNNGGCGAASAWSCSDNTPPTPPTCTDINECTANTDDCDTSPVATCSNSTGSFACACPTGYAGDGHGTTGCVDVDECMSNNGDCDTMPAATCTNTGGGRTCACPSGYSGNGIGSMGCVDINECTADTDDCDSVPAATCTNTTGAFSCMCPMGYTGDGHGTSGCIDIDECSLNLDDCDVSPSAACSNTLGAFSCACPSGYEGTGRGVGGCTDINECSNANGGCDTSPMAMCNNQTGMTNTCTCPAGYSGDGVGSGGCVDINECLSNNGGCGDATYWQCTNNPGPTPTCADRNECSTNNGGCDELVTCTNNTGAAASCGACPAGYTGTGATDCVPRLLSLGVTGGTLTPALSAGVFTYTINVPLITPNVTLTPTVPSGATITINGSAVANGGNWTSSTLPLGNTAVSLVVSQANHPSRTYTLTLTRAGAQQLYVKGSDTRMSDLFGTAIAISGNTMAIGAPLAGTNRAGAIYVLVRAGDGTWSQQAILTAASGENGDRLGESVSISGDTIVAGATYEDSNATGVNGNVASNSASSSGAAYVFVRSGTSWSQQAYLKASNTAQEDYFGATVGISGDTIVVGAYQEDSAATGINNVSPGQSDNSAADSGAAYVFVRSGTTWTQQAYLKAANTNADDRFAMSVSISGNTIVAGAHYEDSIASGVNGNAGDNTGTNSGAAYVFVRSGTTWTQQAYLKASNPDLGDNFGNTIQIDVDTVVVGSVGEMSNATGVGGNQSDDSLTRAGAAYVFSRSGTTWSQQAYLKASNTEADDRFGQTVACFGNTIVVSAYMEDSNATGVNGNQGNNSTSAAGAAYVFTRNGATWSQLAYLKASNPDVDDSFGLRLAVGSDTIAVGSYYEDSNTTGINGDQSNNSSSSSGAVYVFR